ncbi:hypothetical protein EBT31_00650 [bacterium]|nr:hypothetical protein [bacterium]
MKLVRLYVLQDNARRYEDIPAGHHLERIAEIEMSGGSVYHASLLSQVKTRTPRTGARLKQRMY